MNIKDKLKTYAATQQAKEGNDIQPSTITLPIEEYKRLKAIEGAAMEAYDHFGHLSRLGSLARDDDEVVEALGKALLDAKGKESEQLQEVEEAAHVAYELLVYQSSNNPPLSQLTVDSVVERLRKALRRDKLD